MCHNHSPAPDRNTSVACHSHTTSGSEKVPYLAFESGQSLAGGGPGRPQVILATDIFGIGAFYRHVAELLALEGYRVAVPDLFHRVGPPRDDSRAAALDRRRLLDDRQARADFEAVVDEVTGTTGARREPFGVIGFCLGGTLALLSASARPGQATLTWYAFPRGAPGAMVPDVPPIEVAHKINGPVLAFWGREDYIDHEQVDELRTSLAAGHSVHEIVWYDHAGHGFLSGLTERGANTPAAQDSWRRGVSFLAAHVATGSLPAGLPPGATGASA
ncbi:MAG TPA: dienelactone hydrolase family protein [Trebonia sp.]|jgi:carboxymethylenebutenolidase